MSLTTGNPSLDEFMESYLSFMKNLSDRLDELTGAFSQLAQQIDETFQNVQGQSRTAFCSCMGNDVDVMNK